MLFKKDELRLLWPFYAYYLLFGLSAMIFAFFVIYFKGLGFSFLQVSLITAAMMLGQFLFEIPTGAVADSIGRKSSVLAGFLILGFSVGLVPFFKGFTPILIVWIFAGLGLSLTSGAEEAWVIDNLNYFRRKDLYHEFFAKSQMFAGIGMVLAPFAGSLIAKASSIRVLWFVLSAGFFLSAFLLLVFAGEYYHPRSRSIFGTFKNTWLDARKSLRFVSGHRTVFLLVLAGLFISLVSIVGIGEQPLLVSLSMPEYGLGFYYSISALFAIIALSLSGLFKKFRVKFFVSAALSANILVFLLLLFVRPPFYFFAAAILIFGFCLSKIVEPSLGAYFHKFVPKRIRATVVSVKNMLISLALFLPTIIGGLLLDVFGPQKMMAFSGFFLIFAIIAMLKIKD